MLVKSQASGFNEVTVEGEESEADKKEMRQMKIKFTKPGNTRQTTVEFTSRSEMTKRLDELATESNPNAQAELAAIQAQLDEWDKQSKQAEADAIRRAEQHEQKRLADNAQQVQWLAETKAKFSSLLESDPALSAAENNARKEIAQRWFEAQQDIEDRALRLLQDPFSYFEWAATDLKLAAERQLLGQLAHQLTNPKRTCSVTDCVKFFREELMRSVLQNRWRGSSTSEAHNAAQHAMNEVACSWLDGGYSFLAELERNLNKPATISPAS
jgi:hypothetical protein